MNNMNFNQLEIRSNFDNFKVGLVNRVINNYKDTDERQQVIHLISDVTFEQASNKNAFCQDVLPILWDAKQDESDFCHNSQMVYTHIRGGFNKELKVRSYFYGNIKGNPIKGNFNQHEVNKMSSDNENLVEIIKECGSREVLEESNIKLEFIDDHVCSLNIYNTIILGEYTIISGKKHNININISSTNYKVLQICFYNNLEEHKTFMENTGEISGLIV